MSAYTLRLHRIGTDETEVSTHGAPETAYAAVQAVFGPENVRGDRVHPNTRVASGTIGTSNGAVFQASRVWTIREVTA